MKILLVFPRFPESYWSYSHALKLVGKKSLLPPLGLLTVAALLPAHWTPRLVDMNLTDLSDADLQWADYVFVGGMGVQWKGAQETIARAKAAGKKVVGGGPLFTAGYALFQDVDHFILNEAELTLPKFIADADAAAKGQGPGPKRMYRTRDFADMATSPAPKWSMADLKQYAIASIQYSRGCPFDCDFCNVTAMLGRNPRIKTPQQIIAELDALYAAGWRDRIFFVDDNLIGNKRHFRDELLPALIEWQKSHGHAALCTQASINLADDEKLTAQMVAAGFDTVFVGIESSDPASLEECHKSQNRNRDLIADIKKLQRAGLDVQAGFIVGFDHDTEATFQQQVDFIQQSAIVTAMVGQLQAPPGTRLHARMAAEGRLLGISLGDNTDGTTNIRPTMGLEALRKGHAWTLKQLYAPKFYYRRIRALLEEYPDPAHPRAAGWRGLLAFARANLTYGVLGKERFEYWRLLFWVITHRRHLLPMAVRLAAIGRHQRIMSEALAAAAEKAQQSVTGSAADQMLATRS